MDEKQLLEFLDEQIVFEERIVENVQNTTSGLSNTFVKELLLSIGQDSSKHAQLLQAVKSSIKGPMPFINESERDGIVKDIEDHIKLEAEAVKTYGEIAKGDYSDQVKVIAALILEDEIRHHKLLRQLYKTLIEPETLSDDDVWGDMWQNSPEHGAPGM